jgi:CBS domain-containing protein
LRASLAIIVLVACTTLITLLRRLTNTMQLKNVMKRSVAVVAPDTLLQEAARKMSVHNVSVLPVCEGRRIVGLLTARDLTVRATAQGCDPRTSQVREVMMFPAICGREGQNVNEAANLMQKWQIRRLPVLNRRKHLVGIVSLSDLQGPSQSDNHRSKPKR